MSVPNAVAYAEQQLGVHAMYDEAKAARVQLGNLLKEHAKAKSTLRMFEESMKDLEALLITEERTKHPDHSEAAMSRHLKTVMRNDSRVATMRGNILNAQSQVDGLEVDVEVARVEVRLGTARLTELGGYLNYLAAVKTASA